MCAEYSISVDRRDEELEKKFEEFRHAELIITDRLHGMIFAAITGTPCIVINSKSPKVKGCYEWIKDLDYIRFADNVEYIIDEYNKIPKGIHVYQNNHLLHYYEELSKDLFNYISKR
jgi:pyruvyl transferase EpsI